MAITIRDADQGDAELLAELNQHVQSLHAAALPAYFKIADRAEVADLFRIKLQGSEHFAWIAEVDAAPAGYVVTAVRERRENALCIARRFFEIDEIAVSSLQRKRGVARALVERVLAEARAQNVRDVELSSWAFNVEAHAAFRALGFSPKVVRFGRESG